MKDIPGVEENEQVLNTVGTRTPGTTRGAFDGVRTTVVMGELDQ